MYLFHDDVKILLINTGSWTKLQEDGLFLSFSSQVRLFRFSHAAL